MSEEAIQKRRERQLKRAEKQNKDSLDSAEVPAVATTSSISYNVLIPTSSTSFQWYTPDACSYSTIESAKVAGIWNYPSDLQERARCGVFRDLWEQGYFIGGGIKFGAEYLVYPGQLQLSFPLAVSQAFR